MKNTHAGVIFRTVIGMLVIVLLVLGYTLILQKIYNNSALDASVARNKQCADAIHKLMSDKFTREDFDSISSVEDIGLPRYIKLSAYSYLSPVYAGIKPIFLKSSTASRISTAALVPINSAPA